MSVDKVLREKYNANRRAKYVKHPRILKADNRNARRRARYAAKALGRG